MSPTHLGRTLPIFPLTKGDNLMLSILQLLWLLAGACGDEDPSEPPWG